MILKSKAGLAQLHVKPTELGLWKALQILLFAVHQAPFFSLTKESTTIYILIWMLVLKNGLNEKEIVCRNTPDYTVLVSSTFLFFNFLLLICCYYWNNYFHLVLSFSLFQIPIDYKPWCSWRNWPEIVAECFSVVMIYP